MICITTNITYDAFWWILVRYFIFRQAHKTENCLVFNLGLRAVGAKHKQRHRFAFVKAGCLSLIFAMLRLYINATPIILILY